MRWVDRGPEPDGVAEYSRRFTQGWIDYSKNPASGRPADSFWREFRRTLGSHTGNICWYCERVCFTDAEIGGLAPTVDHFRPRSKFPQFAYEWSNWIFSCKRCNEDNKEDKWPIAGFVDPCADDVSQRPQEYFDYDELTGEIVSKKGLTGAARQKALDTIDDLGLNKLDVRFYRFDYANRLKEDLLAFPPGWRQAHVNSMTREGLEFAGTTMMIVEQLRQDGQLP